MVERLDRTRRENLATLLEIVHRDGGASRADLADRTGLNRSTIATHVAVLTEAGLVAEISPQASGRVGRPSPMVVPDPTATIVAINPEVDALSIGVVRLGGVVVERRRAEPVATVDAVVDAVQRVVDERRSLHRERILGVGVAVPGLVEHGGVVRVAPHLGWVGERLGERIAERTGHLVVVDNDATLGARAEHSFGSGRGSDHLLYLNGGASGIGGGVIVDGRVLRGARGFSGELGHSRVGHDELERRVSRSRLIDVLGLTDGADEATVARALADPGSAAPRVRAEVEAQTGVLAEALASAVRLLDPAVIVLGGFLAALAGEELDDAVTALAMPHADDGPRIVPALLESDRLLIGAAEAVVDRILRDPLGSV